MEPAELCSDENKQKYIAKLTISGATGEVINVETGGNCNSSQVVEIINTFSYIAVNRSFGRKDPIIYLSIILSSSTVINKKLIIKPKDSSIDIRFPIYEANGGAETSSNTALEIINNPNFAFYIHPIFNFI